MKRFFLLFVTLMLCASLFLTGCGNAEAEREEELKDILESSSEKLQSNFSGSEGDYSLVSEYLKSWANSNELTVTENADHYIVISNPATEGCGKADSTTLQCQISTKDFSNSLQALSTGMTALLGPENHGDINLIVTENNNGRLIGAEKLPKKYLNCDHFINLEYAEESTLYTGGCFVAENLMTSDIVYEAPAYPNAYEITIKTTNYSDPFNFDTRYPNPVEVLGNLLASEKSSGQLFQLVSFTCDSANGYNPQSANAVVVIDDNDIKSFTSKFNSSYNKVKKKYENLEMNFVYTLTATDMPNMVIRDDIADNIISLLYTLKTGIYTQDEDSGEIIAASAISSISTKDSTFKLKTVSRSLDKEALSEIKNVFKTTSGLCDISFKAGEVKTTWKSDSKKNTASYFTEAIGADSYVSDSILSGSECDIIYAKDNKANIISYRFDATHREPALLNILHFLNNLVE
jgi:di/tripeptidase